MSDRSSHSLALYKSDHHSIVLTIPPATGQQPGLRVPPYRQLCRKMELPEDLLVKVLLELPVKSLLCCKCVCKNWLTIIQSPHFVERQCLLSDTKNSKLLCFRKELTDAHVISVFDRQTFEKLEDLEWPPFVEEEGAACKEHFYIRKINIFGPVNGIYCIFRSLSDGWVGTLTLWNPATKEYSHIRPQVAFPFPHRPLYFDEHGFAYEEDRVSLNLGFGFVHTINQYKVMVIYQSEDLDTGSYKHWHLQVYNHACDTWKWWTVYFLDNFSNQYLPIFEDLEPPFPQLVPQQAGSDCLLNGVFHWACSLFYNRPGYRILTFDMTSEELQLLDGPPLREHLTLNWSVLVLKDNIAAISNYDVEHISSADVAHEVWMMTEYGVKSSWAIVFTLRGENGWVPVSIPYNDRIFLYDYGAELISLSFDDDRQVEEHGLYGLYGDSGVWSLGILKYVETLTTAKPIN